jgi:exosortase F-associated protein
VKALARPDRIITVRIILIVLSIVVLLIVYLFQQFNFLMFFCSIIGICRDSFTPNTYFIFNKTFRLLMNDLVCMAMIKLIFREQKYLQVAFYIFLFELAILLPAYFMLKLSLEGDSEISSPLLSQVHRMIVNPTLMILVMIAFSYQRFKLDKSKKL